MKGRFSSGESWCCCVFSSSLQQPGPSSSPDWQVNWRQREEGTGGSYVSGVDSPVMPDRGECVRCVFNSPFSRQRAAGLDVPWVCCNGVECETLGDLCRRHGTFHILFVGQNQNGRLLKVLNSAQNTHTWRFLRKWNKNETRKSPKLRLWHRNALSVEYLNTSWLLTQAEVKLPCVTGVNHISAMFISVVV